MPIISPDRIPIPTKDVLTWCWENSFRYDQNRPIFTDAATGESITANQTYQLIRKLAAGFHAKGLRRGGVVCIHGFNNIYYPILVLGIIGAGGCFVGSNPSYTAPELEHALRKSHSKMVISDRAFLGSLQVAADKVGITNDKIMLFEDEGDAVHDSWRSLLEHGERDWVKFDDLETAKNTNAFLLFSSGTTGLPKAAQLSHYNLVAQHVLVHENPANYETHNISMVVCLPLFHVAMAIFTHISVLRAGYEVYIMRRFELWDYLNYNAKYQTNRQVLVPPMVVGIVNVAIKNEWKVRKCLSSSLSVAGAAAPLDRVMQGRFQKLLPANAVFTQVWAMTETSCIACHFYHPLSDDTGSVGTFIPNVDVKLIDDNGAEIGPYDVRGELCVRGPIVVRGYLDNPEANSRDWDADGFFHTGDIAMCDAKTKLWYIVDRKKELIKVRGLQVAPAELEGVLLTNPSIKDAAVIGVRFGDDGELPRAYIIKREGASLYEKDVREWMKPRLAKYKQLEGGVKFVDMIPKSPSGKILKRQLREDAEREMGARL